MTGLLIKDLPPDLHQKLRDSATRHHRSLGKEALALLEEMLSRPSRALALPEPVQARFLLTDDFLDGAKNQGRE
jgi:plasmid stability protein